MVLIDTPGVHRADSSLGRKMMGDVREALNGCDLVLMIVDAARKPEPADQLLLSLVKESKTPAFLLPNKIDLLKAEKHKLLPVIEQHSKQHQFREIIPISARQREGLDVLLEKLIAALPEGPKYFPEDQVTDQPARFMAAELIREQLLMATSEEVPHSVTVLVEQFEEGKKLTRIAAAIFCERESQKGILIGQPGADAEEDWYGGAVGDRAHDRNQSISGVICESSAEVARLAGVCGRDGLAQAAREFDDDGKSVRDPKHLFLHRNPQGFHLSI